MDACPCVLQCYTRVVSCKIHIHSETSKFDHHPWTARPLVEQLPYQCMSFIAEFYLKYIGIGASLAGLILAGPLFWQYNEISLWLKIVGTVHACLLRPDNFKVLPTFLFRNIVCITKLIFFNCLGNETL